MSCIPCGLNIQDKMPVTGSVSGCDINCFMDDAGNTYLASELVCDQCESLLAGINHLFPATKTFYFQKCKEQCKIPGTESGITGTKLNVGQFGDKSSEIFEKLKDNSSVLIAVIVVMVALLALMFLFF